MGPYLEEKYWTRPGRTSAWWDNFVHKVVIPEEWLENFRMQRLSHLYLRELLRLHIEDESSRMRFSVDVVKNIACTLDFLGDEACLRKTANAFGLSRQVVSKIIQEVCRAITIHLRPD